MVAAMALTDKQLRLRAEIEEIGSIVAMDHWKILDYRPDVRTTYLELMKNKLVRSEVILKYTLIDELLSVIICHYYFRKPLKNSSFKQLWRTKKFKIFNHYVLDEIYMLSKLRIVRAIKELPREVWRNIERINALRNALAHSFFPENRRQYITDRKVMYQGFDIFTKPGIEKFEEDFSVVIEHLHVRAFGTR